MLYVSFVEIFSKGTSAFEDQGLSSGISTLYNTLSFFGGVLFMLLADLAVHKLQTLDETKEIRKSVRGGSEPLHVPGGVTTGVVCHDVQLVDEWVSRAEDDISRANELRAPDGSNVDLGMKQRKRDQKPVKEKSDQSSGDIEQQTSNDHSMSKADVDDSPSVTRDSDSFESTSSAASADLCTCGARSTHDHICNDANPQENQDTTQDKALVRLVLLFLVLMLPFSLSLSFPTNASANSSFFYYFFLAFNRMGLATAISIAVHNFPEGLATFVATLDEPSVGATLAIAIAIHNIPEGLCVAIPVYYATGNRRKAFLWGFLSGITEPIGAALGWAILSDKMTNLAYGIMFGLVSGMMVTICIKELLPTAHRYDPKDEVVTYCVIGGMLVMAFSLVLFVAI